MAMMIRNPDGSYYDPKTGELISAPVLPQQQKLTVGTTNLGQLTAGESYKRQMSPPTVSGRRTAPDGSNRIVLSDAQGNQIPAYVDMQTSETLVSVSVTPGNPERIDPKTGQTWTQEMSDLITQIPSPEQRVTRLEQLKEAARSTANKVSNLSSKNFYGLSSQSVKEGFEGWKQDTRTISDLARYTAQDTARSVNKTLKEAFNTPFGSGSKIPLDDPRFQNK